jgi:hypothetical protein
MTSKKIQTIIGDILFIQILELKPWQKIELPTLGDALKIIKEYIDKGYTNPWSADIEDFKKALISVYIVKLSKNLRKNSIQKRYIVFNDIEKVFYIARKIEKTNE